MAMHLAHPPHAFTSLITIYHPIIIIMPQTTQVLIKALVGIPLLGDLLFTLSQ